MHQAANVQFERAVHGITPDGARSPKTRDRRLRHGGEGSAFEVLGAPQPMPAAWCASLELPDNATYAAGAAIFLNALAGQTSLPWPGEFPRKAGHSDAG
jgi:hypothetical protein